ncbi:MAG: nicotinate phosphoribosyltransferase [Verrucomicrobia bacterium]|nr:nicotinate phosphoribosyltransferase [Verrucomicrobiota bacterium]MBU6445941.1 nicotinate phosphoribosyltransferase [Verrucomicrobiota bacterium]
MIYNQSLALLTDLYQLTMVHGYWKAGLAMRQAVFHINFRRWPFKGGFAIAAGLDTAIQYLQELRFSESDLAYLEGLDLFEKPFLEFLSTFKFACDFDALPEGNLIFPYEPLIRVKGPIWQAQLLESPMLNILNFQTLIATKAARICLAAHPDPVIEFGMRRAQGIDGAISASRAAFIGGCESTSDVIAGKLFGIPIRGTHAHSWIMAFEEEEKAFEVFAKMRPKHCIMLIDTYNSIEGAKKAIKVAQSIPNFELSGVRLDSGDLAKLSIEIRKLLDQAGMQKAHIMASNELDEYLIRDLKQQGAKIDVWGVGTNLVTGKDQPALDGVYKLAAIQNEKGEWIHKIKLSEQTAKVTNPGILQIRRYFDGQFYTADAIYDEILGIQEPATIIDIRDPNRQMEAVGHPTDLLVPIFRAGKLVYSVPSLFESQALAKNELTRLPPNMERFTNPQPYLAGLEKRIYQKKMELIRKVRG